eukprot:scaffold108980_cov69-Phaeocystis_antarctica.AAC.2
MHAAVRAEKLRPGQTALGKLQETLDELRGLGTLRVEPLFEVAKRDEFLGDLLLGTLRAGELLSGEFFLGPLKRSLGMHMRLVRRLGPLRVVQKAHAVRTHQSLDGVDGAALRCVQAALRATALRCLQPRRLFACVGEGMACGEPPCRCGDEDSGGTHLCEASLAERAAPLALHAAHCRRRLVEGATRQPAAHEALVAERCGTNQAELALRGGAAGSRLHARDHLRGGAAVRVLLQLTHELEAVFQAQVVGA